MNINNMSVRETDFLKIGGNKMPPLKSLDITKEKVWSSNTGRNATGELMGDMIGIKYKLVCTFIEALNEAEVKRIDEAVSAPFFDVYFKDPGTGNFVTKRMYAGTPTYPVYTYSSTGIIYKGVAVDLIEK